MSYRHYLGELSRKPQTLRQVAPELLAELGEPYGRLWALLEGERRRPRGRPRAGAAAAGAGGARRGARARGARGLPRRRRALRGAGLPALAGRCREWPQPVALFFDARYGDGVLPGDTLFLKVVEAIETLAPARDIGKRVGLDKKVLRLTKPFSQLMRLDGSEADFAERVRASRNWYVHHDPRSKAQASDGVDLLRLQWQCEVLLIAHLTGLTLGDDAEAIRVLLDADPIKRRLGLV